MIITQIVYATIEQFGLIPFVAWIITGLIMHAVCISMLLRKVKILKWNYCIMSVFFVYSTLIALAAIFFATFVAKISVWVVAEDKI